MQLMSIKIGLLSVLLLKTCVRKKGGLGGFAPQTLTRSYYFEPPLSKKRSRATASRQVYLLRRWERHLAGLPHFGLVDKWPATPKQANILHPAGKHNFSNSTFQF